MTYIIIFVTAIISIIILQGGRNDLVARFSLMPYRVVRNREWYRLITHGFIHGDFTHLLVNMITLWSFGTYIEQLFKSLQAAGVISSWSLTYLFLYFGGMIAASLYDVIKRRDQPSYSSIGASGAVAAIIFTSVFFDPWSKIYLMGIIPMPGLLFGLLYLGYEWYAGRQSRDNINHYAHIFGALFGMIFPLLLEPSLIHVFLKALGIDG